MAKPPMMDEASGKCTYFQDRRRKWPFYTGAAGKEQEQTAKSAARYQRVANKRESGRLLQEEQAERKRNRRHN